jgi:hypothetical protein
MQKGIYTLTEIIIDRLVPVAVLLLLPIIIIEFFFEDIATKYHLLLSILDTIIIIIFIIDLIFKYLRIRNFKNFIKTCWLDILAVFPFFLIFRVIEPILIYIELPKEVRSFQLVFHEGLEFSKEATKLTKEVEAAGKASRVKTILRLFENLEKTPRIAKALPFYEQPVGKHHLHKIQGKEDYKRIKKELSKDTRDITKNVEEGIRTIKTGKIITDNYKLVKKQLSKNVNKEIKQDFKTLKNLPKKI